MTTLTIGNMSERELQKIVLDLAEVNGWMHYHTYDSRRSAHGWPDLVLCRPPEIIFVELKSNKGRLTPHQKKWQHALFLCGLEAYVWNESHWWDGLIERRLERPHKQKEKGNAKTSIS